MSTPEVASGTSALESVLAALDESKNSDQLESRFARTAVPILSSLLRTPLNGDLTETGSPADIVNPVMIELRQLFAEYDDLALLSLEEITKLIKAETARGASSPSAASARVGKKRSKRSEEEDAAFDSPLAVLLTNAFVVFYGLPWCNDESEVKLRFAFLQEEREALETSSRWGNANSQERRAMSIKTVLRYFSDRGRRHAFSAFWNAFLAAHPPSLLHLHFLSHIGTAIVPHLNTPLTLSDYLTDRFSRGGLISVLALHGLFVLITQHGLEYPAFYDQLYALITPECFSSRHRYQLFELVELALSSVRLSAYVAAGFIKRVARVLVMSPTPALYFGLPFIRKLLQRHPNTLCLIHRDTPKSLEDIGDEEVRKLFEGEDPYDFFEPKLEDCNALNSTLWEMLILERHFMPAVSMIVTSLASPVEDTTRLRFEKTYGRLFLHEMTRRELPGRAYVMEAKRPKPDDALAAKVVW